jgi:hypothetical protein
MRIEQAVELVELAESRGLLIVSAPCSLLGETAQTLWKLSTHKQAQSRGRAESTAPDKILWLN